MKLVKALAVIVVALGVIAICVWQFWLKEQVKYAKVATAYGAKMVCSCRFVAEREMESCKGDFTEDVSAVSFNETDQTIRASVPLIASAEARFEQGLGCVLIEDGS
ncbi:hypothetical protein [Henriciella litoralis]|uniref:hypothetical protein n=1 Tax=Henriciella litoralis TaxID=568102 RepID=UPI000A02C669|nr:hypothetical protein [Henriciella litoralis]